MMKKDKQDSPAGARDYTLLDAGAGWELRARRAGTDLLIEKWTRESLLTIPGTRAETLASLLVDDGAARSQERRRNSRS